MASRFEIVGEVESRFELVDDKPSEISPALETLKNIGRVYPVLETLGTFATNVYGLPAAGLAGLVRFISTGDIEEAHKIQETVANALIYQPQTGSGRELTETAFYPFEKLSEGGAAAQSKLDEFGFHPAVGATVKTLIEASPIFVGAAARSVRGARARRISGEAPPLNATQRKAATSELLKEQFEQEFAGIIDAELVPEMPTDVISYGGVKINPIADAWIKHVGEPVWDGLVQEGIPRLLEKVPGGKSVNRALIYDYRGDLPGSGRYISSLESKQRLQAVGREYAIDLGNRLQSFSESQQMRMGEHIRGNARKLTQAELSAVTEAKDAMLMLGEQAVEAGLLSEEVFFKNAGQYMPRLYEKFEYQENLTKFGIKAPDQLDLRRFMKRKDIPAEIRKEMGEILTPGYPIAKGITQMTHDITTAKFFNGISENVEWSRIKGAKTLVPEGWKQLPQNRKLGKLSEAYVHPEIFKDITETISTVGAPSRVWRNALGAWKYGKVIIAPKTHARNMMSNSVLAHLGGMPMYEQPRYLVRAAKSIRRRDRIWYAIRSEGGGQHTFTAGELGELFGGVESRLKGVKANSLPEKFGVISTGWEKSKAALKKPADLYQAEEMLFKTAKFIHNKERKGMSSAEAWVDAEKWLFNYSKLPKAQAKFRTSPLGAPFATFSMKALPRVAEAAIKTPWRFALPAAMIFALEEAARAKIGDTRKQAAAKKELRPEWMKGAPLGMPNFVRVPFTDEDGREHYLNLTYILPWGDIGEAGNFGPIPGGVMPFTQPFVKDAIQQIANYDNFWGEEIVKETDIAGLEGTEKFLTAAKIRGKHLARSILPTPFTDVTKAIDAIRGTPDYRGRFRGLKPTALDVIAGIKMYPVDYEEQVARFVGKNHPKTGSLARKIMQEIRTLAIKKEAVEKRGGDVEDYDKQIADKIEQLVGLAVRVGKMGELLEEATTDKKSRFEFVE